MIPFSRILTVLFLLVSFSCVCAAQDTIESIQEKLKQNEKERQELINKLKQKRDELDKYIKTLENGASKPQTAPLTDTGNTSSNNGNGASSPGTNAAIADTATSTAVVTETQPQTTNSAPKETSQNARLAALTSIILRNAPTKNNKAEIDITLQSNTLLPLLFDQTAKSEKTDEAVADVEAARTDKLLGANAKSAGTTSLVSKGAIPLIFSLATEYGAAVSSVSGTSMTFHFNPVGLTDFVTGRPKVMGQSCNSETGLQKTFCRTSVGITYDISRGVETPMFTGSKEQLSQLSFRYQFLRRREPNAEQFAAKTAFLLNNVIIPVSSAQMTALRALLSEDNQKFTNAALQNWLDETNVELRKLSLQIVNGSATDKAVKDVNEKLVNDVLVAQLAKLPVEDLNKDVDVTSAISKFTNADAIYRRAKQEYLKSLYREWLVTLEYVNDREINAPDSSNLRMILEKGFGNGTDFTFNGSFTYFHSRPVVGPMVTADEAAKFKRLRDFSFAAQLDVPLFGVPGMEDSTFSLAAKYQRMNTDAFVFNNVVFSDIKGDVLVGQAKLNLSFGKSGLFLPLSFTYANRSELIREKESRGNVGFTFDLSPLFEKYLNGLFPR